MSWKDDDLLWLKEELEESKVKIKMLQTDVDFFRARAEKAEAKLEKVKMMMNCGAKSLHARREIIEELERGSSK